MVIKPVSIKPKTDQPSFITGVMQSLPVLVILKGEYHIATYQVYIDPFVDGKEGYWLIKGHNGNWDEYVVGWIELPPLS